MSVQAIMEPGPEEEDLPKDKVQYVLKLINAVRKRKGLPVMNQVVAHAEKQRTLSKKK